MLDLGAANLEDRWLERKAEARLKSVHFYTCGSLVKYLHLEGKNSGSTKIRTMYHQ